MIFSAKNNWCEKSAAALSPLISPDIKAVIDQQILNGSASLFFVTGDGIEAWLLVSYEQYPSGGEIVLEAIAGRGANAITKEILKRAKNCGFKSARFETHHAEKVAEKLISGTNLKRRASVYGCDL